MTLRLQSKTLNSKPPKPQTHSSELESPVLPNALATLIPKDIPIPRFYRAVQFVKLGGLRGSSFIFAAQLSR